LSNPFLKITIEVPTIPRIILITLVNIHPLVGRPISDTSTRFRVPVLAILALGELVTAYEPVIGRFI